jgi:hypothetical protein
MSSLFIKGVLAAALAFGAINSFAQDGGGAQVTCGSNQCSCTNGSNQSPSQCCGTNTCTLSGSTCSCT